MDDVKSKFREMQPLQSLIWIGYIDDVFFIWTHGEEKLQSFPVNFNNCNPHIKFTF